MKVCIVGASGKLGKYMVQHALDSSGTVQAVLDHASPGARLVFSCGWHITRNGRDAHSAADAHTVRSINQFPHSRKGVQS